MQLGRYFESTNEQIARKRDFEEFEKEKIK